MPSVKKSQVVVPQTADTFLSFKPSELFAEVFGVTESLPTEAERAEARTKIIESLPLDKKKALCAYLLHRAAQYAAIADIAVKGINAADQGDFPSDNSLVTVYDKENGEDVGALHIYNQTTTTTKLSTENKKTRETVLAGLDKAIADGVLSAEQVYGSADGKVKGMAKRTVDLQNDALYAAKEQGLLPTSISDLLVKSVATTESRVTTFIAPVAKPSGTEGI